MPASESTFYATGRRKTAIARVWLVSGAKGASVNGRSPQQYFGREDLAAFLQEPFRVAKLEDRFRVRARVLGGGIAGQAGAVRLGIARALVSYDETLRPIFKKIKLLTRDPREKERKKFGQKGARKRFQYTKR
ncbi:MAG: 30S ribosomal protein S9 [Omnitrophica bacterium GWA2_52_12]|nr:MAG: 30S ribosomal protein S9 [Omnitrophica bacterium GWA2_52_12]